jgi:hypothetical protein
LNSVSAASRSAPMSRRITRGRTAPSAVGSTASGDGSDAGGTSSSVSP